MGLKQKGKHFIELTVEEFKQIKDAYFQKKKGEALERASTPITSEEAASLGNFEPIANLTGNAVKVVELLLAQLAYGDDDIHEATFELHEMVDNIFRASGSKQGKRMAYTFDTIREIQPEINQSKNYPTPEILGEDKR